MRLKAIYILLVFSFAGFILVWASSPIITDYEIIEEKALSNQNDDDFNTMMNVLTHQRCVNCHPNDHIPKQGDDSHPHYFDMARGEDDPFYFRKVQGWIKTQREELSSARKDLRQKAKGSEARVASHQAYIRNLERYLRDGDYIDDYYGEYQQNRIKWRRVVPAYDANGNAKRTHGVFYSDIGTVWDDLTMGDL